MSKWFDKIRKKAQNQKGETIIETIYSLLMIVLALTMMAGSLLTAAKINTTVKNQDTSVMMDHMIPITGVRVQIEHGDRSTDSIEVEAFQTKEKNGYFLYH